MEQREIIIYGAGGFAREAAWLIQDYDPTGQRCKVACFVDDESELQGQLLNDIPVLSLDQACEQFPSARAIISFGNPKSRESAAKHVEQKGLQFDTVVHPGVEMSKWVVMGPGTVISAGSVLTVNISMGNHVQVNANCTVGHDVTIGDFTTLSPGALISGWVHIGKLVFVGTGAVVINGSWKKPVIIEDNVTIGAGACVTKSLSGNRTYVGIPAKPLT
jgi:sugar O-acyltransferase (sialic acid O-acetyltransferase NeuD family)